MKHRDTYIPGDKGWSKKQQFKGNEGTWLPYYPGPSITPFKELHKPTLQFRTLLKEAKVTPLYFMYRNYLYYAEQLSATDVVIPPGSGGFDPGYTPLPPEDDIHSDFLPPTEGFPFLRFGKVRHVTIGNEGDYIECHAAAISGNILYFCGDQKHLYSCVLSKSVVLEGSVVELGDYYINYIEPNNSRCIRMFPVQEGLVIVERYRIASSKQPRGKVPHDTVLTPEAKGDLLVPGAVLAWQTYWWDVDAYPIQCTEQQEFLKVYKVVGSEIFEVDSLGEMGKVIEEYDLESGNSNTKSNYAKVVYPAIEGTVSIGSGAQLTGESSDIVLSVYSSMIQYGGFVLINCDGIGKVYSSSSGGFKHVGFYRIEDNYITDTLPGHSMTDIANLVQVL